MKHLLDTRCINRIKDGVKLLADGATSFTSKINIEVSRASAKAIANVEANGGTLIARYYTKQGLRVLTLPHKYVTLPKFAEPIRRKDIEFYSDEKNRGYLAASTIAKDPEWVNPPTA